MAYDLTAARRAVFAECRAQGLDEATRHQLIRDIGHVASGSSKDMGATACRRVIEHLRKTGDHRKTDSKTTPWAFIDRASADKQPLLRKICALCIDMGVGRAYAEGVAKRQHGMARKLEMMDASELHAVVGALARTRGYVPAGAKPGQPRGAAPTGK